MYPCPLPKDEKVVVVSTPSEEEQQEDEEEAPEELLSYHQEVSYEQPGDMHLEQADFITEPQDLACQQAQTPEVLNGGSHQAEQGSPSQEEGVCGLMGFCVRRYVCVCVLYVSV